jgi:hypothetical protein
MLLSLMSFQLLKTAIALSTIVVATRPEAMMFDLQMYRLVVTIKIGSTSERLEARGAGLSLKMNLVGAEARLREGIRRK